MPIKKSVRLADHTIKLCNELTKQFHEKINWSGSINAMAEQYKVLVDDCLPHLTDDELKALCCVYDRHIPHPDLHKEISMMTWHVENGFKYNEKVRRFLDDDKVRLDFIEEITGWSTTERLAVLYKVNAFLRSGICNEEIH